MSAPTAGWRGVRFGLGLLEIGKPWGAAKAAVPSLEEALAFLDGAFELGVRVFDTAPSYGDSEAKFGAFLDALPADAREQVMVATKFGEHWDAESGTPFVDHSAGALRRSLEESLRLLGRIDILQVHKTTPEVLRSAELERVLEEALRMGVGALGASVSDLESARVAVESERFSVLQFPLNAGDRRFAPVAEQALRNGKLVFANRPLKMGEFAGGIRAAVAAVREIPFDGAVLFGTRSLEHLCEDWEAFREGSGE